MFTRFVNANIIVPSQRQTFRTKRKKTLFPASPEKTSSVSGYSIGSITDVCVSRGARVQPEKNLEVSNTLKWATKNVLRVEKAFEKIT